MAHWHPVDLTDIEVAPAVRALQGVGATLTSAAAGMVRDATYISVGFGVLAFQRLQVERRQFERSLRG